MFEQYAQVLRSDIPHLHVEGETYPPPLLNQYLSNVVFVVRMALLLLLAAGPDALRYIGIEHPPPIYVWAQENKITAFLILFLLGGQIENQLLSTGAFEVYLNGDPVWSKLESGRLPSLSEMKGFIEEPHQFVSVSEGPPVG